MKNKYTRLTAITCALLGSAAVSQAVTVYSNAFDSMTGLTADFGSQSISSSQLVGAGAVRTDAFASFGSYEGNVITITFDWKQDSTIGWGGLTFFEGAAEKGVVGTPYSEVGYWNLSNTTNSASPTGATVSAASTLRSAFVKITLNGTVAGDLTELWLNPTGVGVVDTSGTAYATSSTMDLDGVTVLRLGGEQAQTFDNLVVTAIPEPSAALLGGLGVLALLRRRR